jgi:hypothetical protein
MTTSAFASWLLGTLAGPLNWISGTENTSAQSESLVWPRAGLVATAGARGQSNLDILSYAAFLLWAALDISTALLVYAVYLHMQVGSLNGVLCVSMCHHPAAALLAPFSTSGAVNCSSKAEI